MLLKLSGRALKRLSASTDASFVGRICARGDLPEAARSREVLLADETSAPPGFRAYLYKAPAAGGDYPPGAFALAPEFHYLAHGDVVRVDPARGSVTVLYRRGSASNSFLVTERCDNYCLMCSQPPKTRDDTWLVDELEAAIPLVDPATKEIGITGGEPTLLGPRLVGLVTQLAAYLPRTAVHVLSNGRGFRDETLAQQLGAVRHPDLMVGVPLYSDVAEDHDFVVQATGAYDDTLRGIMNLKRHGTRVELRFVVHEHTYRALPSFARFVVRNLLFVDHVALMGLEQMGFAKANFDELWVDPLDYMNELAQATRILERAQLNVSIYNHQLCVLPPALHRFARASISDWKNVYLSECAACTLRPTCGGFFASSVDRRSRGIAPAQ